MILKQRFFVFGILALYLSHFFILGENTYVLIHDSLDSCLPYLKILKDEKLFFADSSTIIKAMGEGIPRSILPSQFSLISLLFYLFSPFWAFAINSVILHVAAFFAMHRFLSFIDESENENLVLWISLLFSLLPFWPFGGGTLPLMPLVLCSFMKMEAKKDKKIDYLFLYLVPFYSSLYFGSMFQIMLLGVWIIFKDLTRRKITYIIYLNLFFFSLLFLVIEYRLIAYALFKPFVSQRSEFTQNLLNLSGVLSRIKVLLLDNQYHAETLHKLIFLPLILTGAAISLFTGLGRLNMRRSLIPVFGVLLISLISTLWLSEYSEFLRGFELLKIIKFERFYVLSPLLWVIAFFFASKSLIQNRLRYGVYTAILFQVLISFYGSYFWQNYLNIKMSFKDFYATKEIETLLSHDDVRSSAKTNRFIALGFHPAVLYFNQLKSLDFYLPHYPIGYKHLFYEFVKDELSLNEALLKNFKGNAIRAYFLSHEIGPISSHQRGPASCPPGPISPPLFDYSLIRQHGGRFMISICRISGKQEINSIKSQGYKELFLYDLNTF